MTKIDDKIYEIEKYLETLFSIMPDDLERYEQSLVEKLACERCAEIIITATIDLAFLIINDRKFERPDSELQAFEILKKRGVIDEILLKRLQDAKRMRNFLAHEYGEIDDEIVFNSLKEELGRDINKFINAIDDYIKKVKDDGENKSSNI